jgi:phosphoribosylanthranilate isomerase
MTFLKFCGMTRPQDVEIAIGLGVDAIGIVLWSGSPRHVAIETAAKLISMLPPTVTPVGVFVRPSREEVVDAVERTGIRVAQLHGMGHARLEDVPCERWFAISPPVNGTLLIAHEHRILLDAHDPVKVGGTGRTIDWHDAARIAATRSIILAGGLTAANVADAIRTVRPFGVDVASGIETSAGVKNEAAMRAFAAVVRGSHQ